MGAKRNTYSVEYKKGIVEESQNKNLLAFCNEKMLNLKSVRKWRTQYHNLSKRLEGENAEKRKLESAAVSVTSISMSKPQSLKEAAQNSAIILENEKKLSAFQMAREEKPDADYTFLMSLLPGIHQLPELNKLRVFMEIQRELYRISYVDSKDDLNCSEVFTLD